jgi:hypothetical protein
MFSQSIYSVKILNFPVSRDIPVPNLQSVGIFQYKRNVSRDIPVQSIQPVGAFQYNMLSQSGYSVKILKIPVSRDIPVPKKYK